MEEKIIESLECCINELRREQQQQLTILVLHPLPEGVGQVLLHLLADDGGQRVINGLVQLRHPEHVQEALVLHQLGFPALLLDHCVHSFIILS